MNLNEKCTLVVPLKDKSFFTLRLCLYLNTVKCPYKILFADGGLTDENEKILKNYRHLFPDLNFEYHRFPPDNTILDFCKKMFAIYKLVKTPYLKGISNDDFPILETIKNCISFLELDKKCKYSSCGGTTYRLISSGFSCKLLQKVNYKPINMEFLTSNPIDRISSQIPYLGTNIQHSVQRTDAAIYGFSFCEKEKINAAFSQEYFYIKAVLARGKHKQLNEPILIWDKRCDNWSYTIRSSENYIFLNQLYFSLAKELAKRDTNINVDLLHNQFMHLHNVRKKDRYLFESHFFGKVLPCLKYKLATSILHFVPNALKNHYLKIKFSHNKSITNFLKTMENLCYYNDLLKNVQNF